MHIYKLFSAAAISATIGFPIGAFAGTLTTLYTFTGANGVGGPVGPLVYHGGHLYGTTGGGVDNGDVFQVDAKTGAFKILHVFQSGSDGAWPYKGVIYQNGLLYGTTFGGGGLGCTSGEPKGCGTIFSVNPKTGAESILYEFSQNPNIQFFVPSQLNYQNGMLYGSTEYVGASGGGMIFSFDLSTSSFSTLFNFSGADGLYPNSALLYKNGLFYGTTLRGGTGCKREHGCGTVFSINPITGSESVIHAFSTEEDGSYPYGNLIYHGGSFVGDTAGGGNRTCSHGCGVSFSIKAKTGAYKILEAFQSRSESYSGEIVVGGSIYETLPGGGGYGELVQADVKSGEQTVLYTFTGGADGSDPVAPLTYRDGAFYGSTDGGYGTIFKFVP